MAWPHRWFPDKPAYTDSVGNSYEQMMGVVCGPAKTYLTRRGVLSEYVSRGTHGFRATVAHGRYAN